MATSINKLSGETRLKSRLKSYPYFKLWRMSGPLLLFIFLALQFCFVNPVPAKRQGKPDRIIISYDLVLEHKHTELNIMNLVDLSGESGNPLLCKIKWLKNAKALNREYNGNQIDCFKKALEANDASKIIEFKTHIGLKKDDVDGTWDIGKLTWNQFFKFAKEKRTFNWNSKQYETIHLNSLIQNIDGANKSKSQLLDELERIKNDTAEASELPWNLIIALSDELNNSRRSNSKKAVDEDGSKDSPKTGNKLEAQPENGEAAEEAYTLSGDTEKTGINVWLDSIVKFISDFKVYILFMFISFLLSLIIDLLLSINKNLKDLLLSIDNNFKKKNVGTSKDEETTMQEMQEILIDISNSKNKEKIYEKTGINQLLFYKIEEGRYKISGTFDVNEAQEITNKTNFINKVKFYFFYHSQAKLGKPYDNYQTESGVKLQIQPYRNVTEDIPFGFYAHIHRGQHKNVFNILKNQQHMIFQLRKNNEILFGQHINKPGETLGGDENNTSAKTNPTGGQVLPHGDSGNISSKIDRITTLLEQSFKQNIESVQQLKILNKLIETNMQSSETSMKTIEEKINKISKLLENILVNIKTQNNPSDLSNANQQVAGNLTKKGLLSSTISDTVHQNIFSNMKKIGQTIIEIVPGTYSQGFKDTNEIKKIIALTKAIQTQIEEWYKRPTGDRQQGSEMDTFTQHLNENIDCLMSRLYQGTDIYPVETTIKKFHKNKNLKYQENNVKFMLNEIVKLAGLTKKDYRNQLLKIDVNKDNKYRHIYEVDTSNFDKEPTLENNVITAITREAEINTFTGKVVTLAKVKVNKRRE